MPSNREPRPLRGRPRYCRLALVPSNLNQDWQIRVRKKAADEILLCHRPGR